MSDAVAIVGLITTAAAGILAPVVGAKIEARARRVDEIRDVVDEAAKAVVQAVIIHEDLVFHLWEEGYAPASKEVQGAFERREQSREQIHWVRDRVGLRLSTRHPVFHAFQEVIDAIGALTSFAAAYEAGESYQSHHEDFEEALKRIREKRQQFIDTAERTRAKRRREVPADTN